MYPPACLLALCGVWCSMVGLHPGNIRLILWRRISERATIPQEIQNSRSTNHAQGNRHSRANTLNTVSVDHEPNVSNKHKSNHNPTSNPKISKVDTQAFPPWAQSSQKADLGKERQTMNRTTHIPDMIPSRYRKVAFARGRGVQNQHIRSLTNICQLGSPGGWGSRKQRRIHPSTNRWNPTQLGGATRITKTRTTPPQITQPAHASRIYLGTVAAARFRIIINVISHSHILS